MISDNSYVLITSFHVLIAQSFALMLHNPQHECQEV